MKPSIPTPSSILWPILLGAIAAGCTEVLGPLSSPATFLLFLSAALFGVNGALASVAFGPIPLALLHGNEAHALELAMLYGTVGFISDRHPRMPIYIPVIVLSFFILGPVHYITRTVPSSQYAILVIQSLYYVFASASIGAILTLSFPWHIAGKSPRHAPAKYTLPIIFTSITAGAGFFVLRSIQSHVLWQSVSLELFVGAVFFAVIAPGLVGWWMAYQIEGSRIRRGLQNSGTLRLDGTLLSRSAPATSDTSHWTERSLPAGSGVFAVSDEGVFIYGNEAFYTLAGVNQDDAIGKRFNDINLDPQLSKELLRLIVLPVEQTPLTTEIKITHNGVSTFYRCSIECEGSLKSARRSSKVFRLEDITHLRRLEPHLLFAQKSKALANAVVGLAHGFNNVLTNVIGQASFARRSTDLRIHKIAFDEIVRSAEHAGQLVSNLLEFAENKSEGMQSTDLNAFLDERLDLLRKMIGDRFEVIFSCSPRTLGVVCDHQLLAYVISELIVNARDAYPSGSGAIRISLGSEAFGGEVEHVSPGARPGTFARLRIEDSGVGMSSEVVSHAFDPFFTTKSESDHDGLGLAAVFAIVRAHDGFMTIESFPDKGTSVSLYLPIANIARSGRAVALDDDDGIVPQDSSAATNQQILIVEDEPTVRDLLAKMLRTLGYAVESCSNGEDALRLAGNHTFDLIIADVMMPKMGGIDLLKNLKETKRQDPVLLMTGLRRGDDQLNGEDVLEKPFDMETLAQKVHKMLRLSCGSIEAKDKDGSQETSPVQ